MIELAEFTDITYVVEEDCFAVITIDRQDRLNALRGRTVDELIYAFRYAWVDRRVASIILTGAGDRAFCAGGDMKERAATGTYGDTEWGTFDIGVLHRVIRDVPKPVIAAVNGLAVGGGHVLHVLCDLSIAASTARFGQAGPRVGSFDAGFGAAYLARVVGEKRARQIWYLLDLYDAQTAERWNLVNEVTKPNELMERARAYARTIACHSPTALKFLKHSFNADTEHVAGIARVASAGHDEFLQTEESREGFEAFAEKRRPDFSPYR
jgi:dihydroxynaphthoic acid synthetase